MNTNDRVYVYNHGDYVLGTIIQASAHKALVELDVTHDGDRPKEILAYLSDLLPGASITRSAVPHRHGIREDTGMTNIIIAIGRNVGDTPMDRDAWQEYQDDVRWIVRTFGGDVVASVVGESYSGEWGSEDAAWFAGTWPHTSTYHLANALARLAKTYGQDAVALTVGTTHIVDAESDEEDRPLTQATRTDRLI